jgi:hypothetical protein
MDAINFCYWLQGFFELRNADAQDNTITNDQAALIEQHLQLVFKHVVGDSVAHKPLGNTRDIEWSNPSSGSFQPFQTLGTGTVYC